MVVHRWFVVAKHGKWDGDKPDSQWNPITVVHAKEMGTRFTACGQWCESWPKWWERPFDEHVGEVCRQCALIAERLPTLVEDTEEHRVQPQSTHRHRLGPTRPTTDGGWRAQTTPPQRRPATQYARYER